MNWESPGSHAPTINFSIMAVTAYNGFTIPKRPSFFVIQQVVHATLAVIEEPEPAHKKFLASEISFLIPASVPPHKDEKYNWAEISTPLTTVALPVVLIIVAV